MKLSRLKKRSVLGLLFVGAAVVFGFFAYMSRRSNAARPTSVSSDASGGSGHQVTTDASGQDAREVYALKFQSESGSGLQVTADGTILAMLNSGVPIPIDGAAEVIGTLKAEVVRSMCGVGFQSLRLTGSNLTSTEQLPCSQSTGDLPANQRDMQQTIVKRLKNLFLSQGVIAAVLMDRDGHTLDLGDGAPMEALRKQRSGLCTAGIWTLEKVHVSGLTVYNDGRIDLGCPEQRVAQAQKREAAQNGRNAFASGFNATLKGGFHSYADGTTIVLETPEEVDVQSMASAGAGGFLDDFNSLQNVCGLGFRSIRIKDPNKSATARLSCPGQ